MPLESNKNLKLFYSIAEVSELFGIPASMLRYWETEFPTIHPKKNSAGVRTYTQDDIEEVRLVYDLVKVRNMKLAAARELIRRNREGVQGTADLLRRLTDIRAQLVDIKQELDSLV